MDTDGTQILEERPARPACPQLLQRRRPAVAPYQLAADTAASTTFRNPLSGFRSRLIFPPHVAWQNIQFGAVLGHGAPRDRDPALAENLDDLVIA